MADATVQTEYETIYILKADTPKETSESIAGRVLDIIKSGGKTTRVENWGRRKLAYEIQRQKRGVYVYLKYLGGGAIVSELERALRLQESVLRYHTVKLGDAETVQEINEEDVRFEHIEVDDTEEEQTLAEELGLVGGIRRDDDGGYGGHSDDSDDDESDSDDEEDDE